MGSTARPLITLRHLTPACAQVRQCFLQLGVLQSGRYSPAVPSLEHHHEEHHGKGSGLRSVKSGTCV
jgi:hypothetical protein